MRWSEAAAGAAAGKPEGSEDHHGVGASIICIMIPRWRRGTAKTMSRSWNTTSGRASGHSMTRIMTPGRAVFFFLAADLRPPHSPFPQPADPTIGIDLHVLHPG
jgi:hypothetical protein